MARIRDAYAKNLLRRATRCEHVAAEHSAVTRALFDQQPGSATYIRLPQGFHALYARWEQRHAAWLLGDLKNSGWQYQTRLPAIEDDLHELGAQPEASLVSADEPKLPRPAPNISPVSWGSLLCDRGLDHGRPNHRAKIDP